MDEYSLIEKLTAAAYKYFMIQKGGCPIIIRTVVFTHLQDSERIQPAPLPQAIAFSLFFPSDVLKSILFVY